MRHKKTSRSFGRLPNQRKALFRGLASSLIEEERIETTLARAKELRRWVEPLVTLAKRGDLHSRRLAAKDVYGKKPLSKLFGELAERFQGRPGGYTRIYKSGFRRGDRAPLALIEFLPGAKDSSKPKGKKKEAKKDSSEKKAAPKSKEKTAKKTTKKTAKKTKKAA